MLEGIDRTGAEVGRDAVDPTQLAHELRRDAKVIRDRVDRFVVVAAPSIGHPSSEGGMTPRSLGFGQRAVGDFADELGLERVLPVIEHHQVAVGEGRQRPLGPRERLGVAQADDGFDGAARADDRAVLEDGAINGRERVEPSCDQPAQGDRQIARFERPRTVGPDGAVGVADECRELLDEERVAAAAVPELGHELGGGVLLEVCFDERGGGVAVERVEMEDGGVVATGCRCPTLLELGTSSGDQHEGKRAERAEEPVDELEHDLVAPVQIGEDEHERPFARERLEVPLHCPQRLAARSRRVHVGSFTEPAEQVQEAVRDALDVRVVRIPGSHAGDRRLHLPAGVVRGVVELDAARVPDGLGDRPPDVGLAVGHAPALQHGRAPLLVRHRRELDRQPALAHSRFAEQQHELRTLSVQRRVQHASQQRHLGVASDERRAGLLGSLSGESDDLFGGPRFDRLFATFDDERAERLVAHDPAGGLVGERADDHLTGACRGLEAARGVHDVAHGRVLAGGAHRSDQHLAGVHAHSHLGADAQVLAEGGERALHLERRPHRPLGVVLVGDGRAEQGHDGVSDDLVDLAAERGHVGDEPFEAPVDQVLHVLGVGRLGERGEPDEVGEQDRGDAALVGPDHEGVAAGRAEPGLVRRVRAA